MHIIRTLVVSYVLLFLLLLLSFSCYCDFGGTANVMQAIMGSDLYAVTNYFLKNIRLNTKMPD